jgi:hypothetical protein
MKRSVPLVLALLLAVAPLLATEAVDHEMMWKIRRAATEESRILETLHRLTDVYGPRLTGSPNIKAAQDWAAGQLTAWGLDNVALEPWDFGHPGWTNERLSAFITSPVRDTLTGEVLAWTPGTNGPVKGAAVLVDPPDKPTQNELTAWLGEVTPGLRAKIVLVGTPRTVPVAFNAINKRRDDSEVKAQYDPVNPAPSPFAAMANQPQGPPAPGPRRLTANEVTEQIDQAFVSAGVLVRLNDAGREHGQVRAFNNRTFDIAKAVPTVVLRNEDYGRLARLLAGKQSVELEFDIVNRTHPEGRTQYNLVAEIPGTDTRGEVVMLGGHIDSWHAATGATDNAIGVAVTMEAVRILKSLGVKPRRTIRLALWSGEEQGLLGSQAYVKQHFGTFEDPTPGYDGLVAYVNIDSGTGRARGMSVFGPPEAAAVVRTALQPFADLGVAGTVAGKSRRLGGSDHTAFNQAGLTGIGVGQDPIEYGSHTWHTNLDTFERIVPEDAVKAATAIAGTVYHLATRDERLPRFARDQMPEPPKPEAPAAPAVATTAAGTR